MPCNCYAHNVYAGPGLRRCTVCERKFSMPKKSPLAPQPIIEKRKRDRKKGGK